MPDQDLSPEILRVLRGVAPDADTTHLDPARSFRDQLGIDSIDFLNFIAGIEERFGVRISEADYLRFSTLRGCLAYLQDNAAPPEKLSAR